MNACKWKWPFAVSLVIHISALLILFSGFSAFKGADGRLALGKTISLPPLVLEIRPENRQRPHRAGVSFENAAPKVAKGVDQPFGIRIGRESVSAKSRKSEGAQDVQNTSDEEMVSPDEALLYRLSLARAMRASRKHATSLLAYQGEGYVELAIERLAARLHPEVALKRSSGEGALDSEARALMAEAIKQRPFPATLNALSVALLYEAGHPD